MVSEACRFREVRKGERADVLAFAGAHGLTLERKVFRHHLSLLALDAAGDTLAAALYLEDPQGHHYVEIVTASDEVAQSLVNELADRCLRKVQAQSIGTTRLYCPAEVPAQAMLADANWLDKIEETPPSDAPPPDAPGASEADIEPSQAA